jgi:glutamine synthetase
VFIGSQLTEVLDQLEKVTDGKLSPEEKTDLKLNVVGKIPEILMDNTDRNRTSPFAFTGNRFEFRAVSSDANCSNAMTVINAIVANQLREFKEEVDGRIKGKKMKKDEAIFNVLRNYIKESKKIRFEGDGYSEEWEKEAKKRGLSNNRTTPEALKVKIAPETIEFYKKTGIMNEREVRARHKVEIEEYAMHLQIEGRAMGDIVRNHVIPTAIRYQNTLIDNVRGLKTIFEKDFKKHAGEQISMIEQLSHHIEATNSKVNNMIEARKKANKMDDPVKRAFEYCNTVKPYFKEIRYHCDKMENMIDDELWPLTKYREMMFSF